MRPRLLIAIACLWTGCGPSQQVDRVATPDRPGAARPPASLPDPEAVPPAGALDGGLAAEAGAPNPEGPPAPAPPPARPVDAGAPPDRPPPPAPDAAPPDRAPSAPPPDAAPPPVDRPPPPPDAVAACPPEPAADRIADFEGGALATLRVGARGGTPWTIISLEEGSTGAIAATQVPGPCGSRGAMRFAGTTSADTRAPLVRALLVEEAPDPRFFDARGYRALRVWLKAVPPGNVRIKISDSNTTRAGGVCTGCNNHFLLAVAADGELRPYVIPFAEMRQDLVEERQPALNTGALFAVEIGPPRLPAYEVVVDDVSFVK
jgi:hypothetical protein